MLYVLHWKVVKYKKLKRKRAKKVNSYLSCDQHSGK